MAEIVYNGIVLPYCKNTQYTQDAVYDEETDWYRTDISVATETYFTSEYLQLLNPQLIGRTDNAAQIMQVLRSRLLKPRQAFSMKCAGVEIIPQPQTGMTGTVDIANGPQPQYCNVLQMNDSTFVVGWSIKASYWENNRVALPGAGVTVTNRPGNPVISCRWGETQDINNLLYTTRTRTGKFIIRSDNSQQSIVDRFRSQFAVVGRPSGFLRKSMSYKVDPSGLALEFTLVDEQVFKMPPTHSYEATATYTEQTMKNGAQRWGEVNVSLKGSSETNQGAMILAALGIASAKLRTNGVRLVGVGQFGPNDPGRITVMEYCDTTVGMYENTVSVRMRCRMNQSRFFARDNQNPDRGKYWGWNVGAFTFTPGSDPGPPRDMRYPIRGTAGKPDNRMLLRAAAYYDPSLTTTAVDQATGQFNGGLPEVGTLG